jgi:phage tail-like protein
MADRNDPYRGSRYLLEIDGITRAGFSECSIPDTSQDPIEYREGNELPTVRKIPGLIKYGNLSFKWGITDDAMELYEWRVQVEQGKMGDARRNIAVVILDEEGNPKSRWEFAEAWPTKYDAPDLNATGSDIAIETLEIAHESMVKVS